MISVASNRHSDYDLPPPDSVNTRNAVMLRILFTSAALCFALTACGEAPDTPPANANLRAANQEPQEIAVEKIARDLAGRVVPITELSGDGTPTDWTFEADEFKQVEIVEKQATENAITIVIFMTTRNNAGPNDDAVQVSGKLQLRYEREAGRWTLKTIENLTFRYTVGLAA